jgi:hypothetical protein
MKTEEIDKHVEKHLAENKSFDLCTTYKTVKPVIEFAKLLLFFKPKWQQAIGNFVAVMDKNCSL